MSSEIMRCMMKPRIHARGPGGCTKMVPSIMERFGSSMSVKTRATHMIALVTAPPNIPATKALPVLIRLLRSVPALRVV